MKLRYEFNRIGHLFNDGIEKTQKQAVHWTDEGAKRASKLSRRARNRFDTGTRDIVSVEESIVRHARENPVLYVIGAAVLLGALIARVVMEARRTPQAPVL